MGIEVWEARKSVDVKSTTTIPVATNSLKVDDIVNKLGKRCPICIEKNVIHFQVIINGKKWHWLVSAFDFQTPYSLKDGKGKLLQAMVSAVKGGELNQADLHLMGCSQELDQNCVEWIARQIHQHSPDVVIVMGLSLARLLLMSKDLTRNGKMQSVPIDMVCGEYDLLGLPLIATYHPAEIMADVRLKRQVWIDLQKALAYSTN